MGFYTKDSVLQVGTHDEEAAVRMLDSQGLEMVLYAMSAVRAKLQVVCNHFKDQANDGDGIEVDPAEMSAILTEIIVQWGNLCSALNHCESEPLPSKAAAQ